MLVLLLDVAVAIRWRWAAQRLHWWFNMLSEDDGRPAWRRGHFAPTKEQSVLVAWIFIAVCGATGAIILSEGLGLINVS
jgi:hypothetical protein